MEYELNLVKREKQIILLGYEKGILTMFDIYRFYKDKQRAVDTIKRLMEFGFFKQGNLPLTYEYDYESNIGMIKRIKLDIDQNYNKRYNDVLNQQRL